MRRTLLVLLIIAASRSLTAETWAEAYNRGVSAVRANNFQVGAQALQRAIDETPQENAAQRVRDQIFTYVPHFWLGIAKLNLGDPDGALREWKTSEDQAAIQNTPYFAQLRDLIARANSEKQRRAETAAAPARQEANGAIGRALSAQMDAVTAGGDRSETYHAAQRKLNEAKDLRAKAGIDVRAYKRSSDVADEARALFSSAAEDAKKQRAARPVRPKPAAGEIVIPFEDSPQPTRPSPPVPQPQPPPMPVPKAPVPVPQTPPATKPTTPAVTETQPQAESEALVAARIAAQQYRRRLVAANRPTNEVQRWERQLERGANPRIISRITSEIAARQRDLDLAAAAIADKPVEPPPLPDAIHSELESAFHAYAAGDFATADRLLTLILAKGENADAYLLRGCSRYTQAMLSRKPEALLAEAASDMKAAIRLDSAVRLDRSAFSPKLVSFFENLRLH